MSSSLPVPATHVQRLMKTLPLEYQGLLQPSGLQYFYQRVRCTGEVLIDEYCYSHKHLGNNIEEAHKHWHKVVVVIQVAIDLVVKACALSFSVISPWKLLHT